MYGTISAFKSLDHIELTLSKDGIPLSDTFNWLDLDELFREASFLVVQIQRGSTSMIQRKFKLSYVRAGRKKNASDVNNIINLQD
jgi:DNA segregation ATPase FtsK/SpoIIIE-like protein